MDERGHYGRNRSHLIGSNQHVRRQAVYPALTRRLLATQPGAEAVRAAALWARSIFLSCPGDKSVLEVKNEGRRARTLDFHINQVRDGKRRYENAFQSVARMILDDKDLIEKVVVNGKSTYDFRIFRMGQKHVIGMFDEINSFVSSVKTRRKGDLPGRWPLSL